MKTVQVPWGRGWKFPCETFRNDIEILNREKEFPTCTRHHMYSHTRRLPAGWSEREDPERSPILHSKTEK
jgi:hypothetical protein